MTSEPCAGKRALRHDQNAASTGIVSRRFDEFPSQPLPLVRLGHVGVGEDHAIVSFAVSEKRFLAVSEIDLVLLFVLVVDDFAHAGDLRASRVQPASQSAELFARHDSSDYSDGMKRTGLLCASLVLAIAASGCRTVPPASSSATPWHWEDAASLAQALDRGEITSEELVRLLTQRVEAIDWSGPQLRSVLELNPDALEIARRLDAERAAGRVRGPLHGIPVLIKDNIDTADRMETTAGSYALVGSKPLRDAFLVERLRDAGAIILGKTNLSEWANIRSFNSSSGWSARGGQTRNPHDPTRTPCGSSSGSGAAVAAGLAPLAVGTETDGSILCPSAMNGIVGVKPTVGLVSRSGIIPISHSQDTAGPMARTVRDAAMLLSVLRGADPRDPATRAASTHAGVDYLAHLDRDALRGARIGVVRADSFGLRATTKPVLDAAVEAMKRAGAEIIEVDVPNISDFGDAEFEVLLYELKADLAAYLAGRPDARVRTLADVIAFNTENADREMPWFEQEIFDLAETKGDLEDEAYVKALADSKRLAGEEGIDAVMKEHRLDALVSVSYGPAFLIDLINGDSFTGGSSSPAAVSGYPSISVPAGDVHGLPIGISFWGRAWSEPKLLGLAYAYEQATMARIQPKGIPQ